MPVDTPDIAAPAPGPVSTLAGNSARRLLAALRDVMAGSGSAQSRLDKIVRLIGQEVQADVCSCYVMRAGDILELFSTIGLNPDAVHKTRMRVGEGVVGDIAAHARPMALADARSHPNFSYRPETGEDPFQSMAGVPILRGGRVRGVLVIQHKAKRDYNEEEVETLQTIAMVVAELVAAGELVGAQEISTAGDAALLPTRLEGITLNRGLAMGHAVLHRPQLTIRQLVAEDPEREHERLRQALAGVLGAIDALMRAHGDGSGEHRDILETYRMFAEDRGWLSKIREAINSGLTAEAAVQRVQNDTRARMSQIADPYIRERLLDLDDLNNRLLQHLTGRPSAADAGTLPDEFVLVARSMGPAELLDYDKHRLRGLVLEEGSAASHVAIVARALEIPVVGQCTNVLTRIEPLDPLIVDGDNGLVFVRPAEDIQESFARSMALLADRERSYAAVRDLPAVTRDGTPISINLNCGMVIDLSHLGPSGADGVGLYRTEIPFMVRSAYPDVATQTDLYARVLEQVGDKPVVFRTLDAGGDKVLPYFTAEQEENPALGWRAIRMGLDRPAMLRKQLRALLRASAGRELRVMFPMVAEVAEFDAAKAILDMEQARLATEGREPPTAVRVGAMIEVPSIVWQFDVLLRRVDFLSVGSNDLLQYLFAADRGNPKLATRYDPLSPALLRLLRSLVRQADAAKVPLSVCGEIAGRPLEAMALAGLGYRILSMSPPAVGAVKTMIRSLDLGPLREYLEGLLDLPDHSLRDKLLAYARDHGVMI
ncbi:phosphoenolpyruvate--protein phosphotransferase [Arenibaculum pallidiluteum]|uniref:phosphoenolpyruvate--protein phosphotransferase n=1 Tax=Arenibaculum pallidiluteum TaxID=2812559 RepID=UPI002E2D174A|nr:phosphoenolpyruvate--protein phosphotransferase [Arenibaculum pallidiluteum]